MNTFVWVVILLLLGVVAGKIVGALTAFTRGPAVFDIVTGGVAALIVGVALRSFGSPSFRAPVLSLLAAVDAALLTTWLMRIAVWPPEPTLQRPDDASPYAGPQRRRHDVMTTGEATAILLTQGRLVAPRDAARL